MWYSISKVVLEVEDCGDCHWCTCICAQFHSHYIASSVARKDVQYTYHSLL